MAHESNHAIVFGAAGLLGWSVVNQLLLGYPKHGAFSKVTAVMNRPVGESDLQWPGASAERARLDVISGINLLQGSGDDLARALEAEAPGVKSVTHVFYFVFAAHNDDHIQECQRNTNMMQRVADAFNILSPGLKSVIYSGGTRGYGIYVPGGTFTAPLKESMADNLPEDYAKTVAYPWFRETLDRARQGRNWTWTEVCPDAVVGFSPNGSGFSLALHWAQYLSLYAYHHGVRTDDKSSQGKIAVPFPGTEGGFNSLLTPVSGPTLGRISIHAALNRDSCGGKIINMADNARPTTFRELWPAIAGWFGLVGVGPSGAKGGLNPGEYVTKHKDIFGEKGLKKAMTCGVGAGHVQLDSVGYWLDFDRQLSLERLKEVGFSEERDPREGWHEAFEGFRTAGIIL